MNDAFALAGRASLLHHPQGVALGYELLPLQGEALNTEMRRHGGVETRRCGDTEARRHGGAETRRCGDTEENIMFSKIRRVF